MNRYEKSGPAIVALKPTNAAERSGAEPVEPRKSLPPRRRGTGTEGKAIQQSTRRAQ
jgi:hypothetical protein